MSNYLKVFAQPGSHVATLGSAVNFGVMGGGITVDQSIGSSSWVETNGVNGNINTVNVESGGAAVTLLDNSNIRVNGANSNVYAGKGEINTTQFYGSSMVGDVSARADLTSYYIGNTLPDWFLHTCLSSIWIQKSRASQMTSSV